MIFYQKKFVLTIFGALSLISFNPIWEPMRGIEPPTYPLQRGCSTIELHRQYDYHCPPKADGPLAQATQAVWVL